MQCVLHKVKTKKNVWSWETIKGKKQDKVNYMKWFEELVKKKTKVPRFLFKLVFNGIC